MLRPIQIMRNAASGALVTGLLSFAAQAEERFSELRLDQLTGEQQKMATMLTTPPRNSQINTGPFQRLCAQSRSRHPAPPGQTISSLQQLDCPRA